MSATAVPAKPAAAPVKAELVLGTLIIVAAVANLPLAMANVAAAQHRASALNASQTQLNLVAVAYSLGLACSVLWLGALGDRYGRKMMGAAWRGVGDPRRAHQRTFPVYPSVDHRPALRLHDRRPQGR